VGGNRQQYNLGIDKIQQDSDDGLECGDRQTTWTRDLPSTLSRDSMTAASSV